MSFKNNFKPDIILSNPPYANGSDIDFIFSAFKLAKIATGEITPAKWQTTESTQKINSQYSYGDFREQIVPYIEKLIYYPNCRDIFNIWQIDGITQYIIDKQSKYDQCTIENRCIGISEFNNIEIRDIKNEQSLFNICNKIIQQINYSQGSFQFPTITHNKRYEVWTNTKIAGFDWFSTKDPSYILGISRLIDNTKNESYNGEAKCIFESDNIQECYNFMSFIYSRPVRFLLMANIGKLNNIFTEHCWRFIPNETDFTKQYTDDILLEMYGIIQYKEVINKLVRERNIQEMLEKR